MKELMTVGEIAKKAGVSVRTMQYYDKCGLLKPSSYSEGGNRLYSSKDLPIVSHDRAKSSFFMKYILRIANNLNFGE